MDAPADTLAGPRAAAHSGAAIARWAHASTLIRAEHAAVLAVYHKVKPTTPRTVREAAVRRLCLALVIHDHVEEEIFYPVLRSHGLAMPLHGNGTDKHDRIRAGIARLQVATDNDRRTRELHDLMRDVMHHMADQETQLLPQAEQQLGEAAMCELGARMFERRMVLSRKYGGFLERRAVQAPRPGVGRTALALVSRAIGSLAAWPRARQVAD